jgi:hypothetical protein
LDGVWSRELTQALNGAELHTRRVFGFGDTIAQEHKTCVEWQSKGDGVESGVLEDADGDVAAENRSDRAVFQYEERRDVATVDQFDLAILFVMDGYRVAYF